MEKKIVKDVQKTRGCYLTKITYCDLHGDKHHNGRCFCEPEHRTDVCEHVYSTGNEIQEKGKEYYLNHGKNSDDPRERWVGETIRCTKKGKLRNTCHGFFMHKQVLCDAHTKQERVWYDKACRVCRSPHRSCCC